MNVGEMPSFKIYIKIERGYLCNTVICFEHLDGKRYL